MSTYSTNLAIELIDTGTQAGTWGITTNSNLGTLIEQAISGYVTQAITDGAATVITIPNGATGVARNMTLELTGALTAARVLEVPANKKLYFIYNNTTGGYAVTVKVSGQTGVSVPNGKKMVLVSNGTDIVEAVNYVGSFSATSINNTPIGNSVPSTGAFTTLSASNTVSGVGFSNYLASPPAIGGTAAAAGSFTTLSASSTVSGVGFSNYLASPPAIGGTAAAAGSFTTLSASSTVSGTGFSNYLASPPAIGGTAAAAGSFTTLSASSTVTFSGGTANGVVYLNSSKVATSGSALTFDGSTLALTTTNVAYRGQISLNGSASGYSQITFYKGTTTNTDQVASILTDNSASPSLIFNARNNAFQAWQLNDSEQMRLTSTGLHIGGAQNPAAALDISSGIDATYNTNIIINSSVNSAKITFNPAGVTSSGIGADATGLRFYASGANTVRATIDYSGNLGLGVTPSNATPTTFEVPNGGVISFKGSSANITSNAYYNAGWKYTTSSYASSFVAQGSGGWAWNIAPSGTAGNAITFTQAMTLDASGNLLVGTTTGQTAARAVFEGGNVRVRRTSGIDVVVGDDGSTIGLVGTLSNTPFTFFTNATEKMRLDSSGNLGLGVTPSAWIGYKAIELPNVGFVGSAGPYINLISNAYYNGTNYTYKTSEKSALYTQALGQHQWHTAGTGVAGNTFTFTQAMTLDASGNLLVGTTSVSTKLTVEGSNANDGPTYFAATIRNSGAQTAGVGTGIALSQKMSSFNAVLGVVEAVKENATSDDYASSLKFSSRANGGALNQGLILNSSGNLGVGLTANANTKIDANGPIRAKGYTVATLPTGVVGARAYVTDAVTAVFQAIPTGGGSVTTPVFYNGSNWVCG